jgi:hypothetical protein
MHVAFSLGASLGSRSDVIRNQIGEAEQNGRRPDGMEIGIPRQERQLRIPCLFHLGLFIEIGDGAVVVIVLRVGRHRAGNN